MILREIEKEKLENIFLNLDKYINKKYEKKFVKFINIGSHILKVISYSDEYKPLIEKQLMYVSDNCDSYDATLVIFKEDEIKNLHKNLDDEYNPNINLKLRIQALYNKKEEKCFRIYDSSYSKTQPVLDSNFEKKSFSAYNKKTNTYYYAVCDLNPEEFIKEGHIFVQAINKVVKTNKTNLVHGAVVGLNNNGVLFCARGQRGKSTLTVLSMIKGFEYVSDDYLVLEKEDENLYSYPIYSIITLSPKMYNELYDELQTSRFVSNNARKDKYVFNISNFKNQFRSKYPIKICMFPEIVQDKNPSIVPCKKGRAIVQLIQSTLSQMKDINEPDTILKLLNMVKDFDFYKINLCSDIYKNTEFLREFLKNIEKRERKTFIEDDIYQDITFNVANLLDCKEGIIYQMNKFATNIYENLLSGVDKKEIVNKLLQINGLDCDIIENINIFENELNKLNLLKNIELTDKAPFINEDFIKEDKFKLSFKKFDPNKTIELIKKGD